MTWDKKIPGLVISLTSLAFIGLILIQALLLKQAVQQRLDIFDSTVNGVLWSITHKLETQDMLKRIVRVSVGVDSSGDYSTTIMHIFDRDEANDEKKFVLKNLGQFKSDVQLDSNKIVLHLRTDRHISLIKLDENKEALETVYDDTLSSGIHEIPLDHISKDPMTNFNLLVDKEPYFFYLDKSSPGRLVIDPELDNARRALLDKVIEQYMVFGTIPLEERIDIAVLDSIVQSTLWDSGIKSTGVYGILSVQNDSVIYQSQDVDHQMLKKSLYRTLLFPNDAFVEPNELILYFPHQKRALFTPLVLFAAITLVLLSVIIASFVLVIRSVQTQKGLAKRLVDFINNMTHEFKTPLSTIAIAGNSIADSTGAIDKDRLHKYGNIIQDETSRMRRQVEKILDMAALERGDFDLNYEKADIHVLIDEAVDHFALSAEKYNAIITKDLAAINRVNLVDTMHLVNCLHNLLDNAIKYSNSNPIIHVFTKNIDPHIQISVKDHGIGLRPEEIKRVFEKYYRVPTGNVHNVKGLGLGLSYVKFIAEAHGGYVEVDSEIDDYSIFSIFLPLHTDD
jgi:two-component system, OmpR family, phosphate regulon sensor histidine kinase PhoR